METTPPEGISRDDWRALKSALLVEAKCHGAYSVSRVTMELPDSINPKLIEFDDVTFPHILTASRELVRLGHLIEYAHEAGSTNPNDICFVRR